MNRPRASVLLATFLATASALAAARPLSTDRPDATESPFTVEDGRVQFEVSAAQFTRERHAEDRGAPAVETWSFAPLNVRVGLSPRTELQIVHDGQVRIEERDRATGVRTRADGLGDVTLRFKANLRGNDEGRLGLGAMPYLKLPTAAAGIGNDELEGGLILPLAYELSEDWGFGAMTEMAVVRNDAGTGYRASWLNTATVSRAVGAKGGIFAEVTVEVGEGSPAVTFNTGATFAVNDDLQFDVGANVGLTRAADDLTVFAGFAWRY